MNEKELNVWEKFAEGVLKQPFVYQVVFIMLPIVLVTKTTELGLLLGLITAVLFFLMSFLGKVIKKYSPEGVYWFIYLLMAVVVTFVFSKLAEAYLYQLYQQTVVYVSYITLLSLNIVSLAHVITFKKEDQIGQTIQKDLKLSLGLLVGLVSIGLLREVLGTANIQFQILTQFKLIKTSTTDYQMTLFQAAPGAYILLGLLAGFYHWILKNKEEQAI